uniref:Transposase n=1 Tax=Candidatus Kentrum sp. TC TaxID=2126339 RepID=A0A450Z4P6_9GAMM|nr:MAG: Putative transposase [Candidatus Kentron sp. TC]
MPSSPQVRGLSFPFAKERGFLPAVTVLHTFGSDLRRHVHIHFIVSNGGLKLSGKVERFTRYVKRKPKNRRTRKKKVLVLVDEPSWFDALSLPHKALRKCYQRLLIEHLKEKIRKEPSSDTPDPATHLSA